MTDEEKAATSLIGEKPTAIEQANGGGNSRVYKVTAGGKSYALKRYPEVEKDPRDRLSVEKQALQFFDKNNITCVPKWLNAKTPFALMQWIDASPVTSASTDTIDQAVAFLSAIHRLSPAVPANAMPLASEACLSGFTIASQVESRLERLQEVAETDIVLQDFLTKTFMPAMKERLEQTKAMYAKAGWEFEQPLPQAERTLIAADFGFHNALMAKDNRLIFIDFEYFGWDDPVKLLADFLLHPAMTLTEDLKQRFLAKMQAECGYPASVLARFEALYPLFGLRWTLILLNEFLPERWQARALARGESNWASVKQRQLEKARLMLTQSAHGQTNKARFKAS